MKSTIAKWTQEAACDEFSAAAADAEMRGQQHPDEDCCGHTREKNDDDKSFSASILGQAIGKKAMFQNDKLDLEGSPLSMFQNTKRIQVGTTSNKDGKKNPNKKNIHFFHVASSRDELRPEIPSSAMFWQRIWDHPDRASRQTLKREPLAKPPANKSDPSAKPSNKRKRQDDCVPCNDKMPHPTKQQPAQQLIVSPTPKDNSVLRTDFQDWVNLLHQDFKRNHLGWEFPFNIVSLVPTAKALLPNKLLTRFEDEPVSKKHEDELPSKKKQDVGDIVVNGRTAKDAPVLFGVHSHSLVVKLSRSHLQMRALKRVPCRLRCMPQPTCAESLVRMLHHTPKQFLLTLNWLASLHGTLSSANGTK
jgi:hypothetical protein